MFLGANFHLLVEGRKENRAKYSQMFQNGHVKPDVLLHSFNADRLRSYLGKKLHFHFWEQKSLNCMQQNPPIMPCV